MTLKTAAGQAVSDAVVFYKPASGVAAPRPNGKYVMVQEGVTFKPGLMIVPVGAEVSFPNHDKVRHHVYSFSAAKKFELKLYGRQEARSVLFDKPGVVALGCNIHDRMSAFIFVSDTPFVAKSDGAGRVVLPNLPNGPGVLTVWHADMRAPKNQMTRQIATPAGAQAFVLTLRPTAPRSAAHAH